MKETVTIGQAFEKYTIDNYKEFVDKALGFPDVDFENEEAFGKFLNENRVQIISQGKLMELPYDADVINEIEFALKEINEVYNGTAECTAGNTVSSMYRNASYKDILVANMLRIMDSGKSYKDSIRYTINNFGETAFRETMKYIENNAKTLSEEYGVNYHQLNTMSLAVLFNTDTRRNTIIDLLCQKVEILEGKDNDDYHSDIVFLMDFSIKRSGDLIAWHYGADFNINSKTNQEYIRKYIADLTN